MLGAPVQSLWRRSGWRGGCPWSTSTTDRISTGVLGHSAPLPTGCVACERQGVAMVGQLPTDWQGLGLGNASLLPTANVLHLCPMVWIQDDSTSRKACVAWTRSGNGFNMCASVVKPKVPNNVV